MPDNFPIDPSTGPNAQPVATDVIGGVHYQVVKPAFGVDGTATPVSAVDPLPTADDTARATLQAINDLSDSMLYLLSAMLEKMPRLTKEDRVSVALMDASGNEVNTALFTTNTGIVGDPQTGRFFYRMLETHNFSDAGCARLYQNITVS